MPVADASWPNPRETDAPRCSCCDGEMRDATPEEVRRADDLAQYAIRRCVRCGHELYRLRPRAAGRVLRPHDRS